MKVHKSRNSKLTFAEAIDFISSTPSANKELFRGDGGFGRAQEFFNLLSNPQEDFRSVHIAGTSGKGTVAHMIEALLRECGQTTGLSASPHVYDIRERSMVNGEMITKENFAEVVSDLVVPGMGMKDSSFGRPTYFEMTNAVAFQVFAQRHVDYGIIEVGLGGLYDSTNTIVRNDKLAVITKLGLDHTEILGDTIEKIATQKAGILPVDGYATVWRSAPEALAAIEATAADRGTMIDIVDETFFKIIDRKPSGMTIEYRDAVRRVKDIKLPAGGSYQAENAAMAIRSVLYLAQRDGFEVSDSVIRDAMSKLAIPGRVEKRRLFNRNVIFDGAHNPQKMNAFLDGLKMLPEKPIFVVGLKKTKEADEIIRLITPHASQIVVTQFFTSQESGLVNASYQAAELAGIVRQQSTQDALVEADSLTALMAACKLARPEQTVVVTGSFYLLGELHDRLRAAS